MAFDFISSERELRKLYPKIDVSSVRDISVKRVEPQITYTRDKDVPHVLRQAVQNVLMTATAGNWGAARVEKPRSLFVWEVIRALSVASCCRLTTITFAESSAMEPSQQSEELEELLYEDQGLAASSNTQPAAPPPPSPQSQSTSPGAQAAAPAPAPAPSQQPSPTSSTTLAPSTLAAATSGSARLVAMFEEQIKRGGSCNIPSEFVLRTLVDEVANTWVVSLLIDVKDISHEENAYPLIAKLVCAWQLNAKNGVFGPVRGCLTTFESWWFCEFRPASDCTPELPSGIIVTRNPLQFATVEMPYYRKSAAAPKSAAKAAKWEFVPYAGVMDVIGILRDTLLPNVKNFRSAYEEGAKPIRDAAKKGVARAKTFYEADTGPVHSLLKW